MRRVLCILGISLLPFIGAAQVIIPDLSAPVFAGNDKFNVVEEFTATLEDRKKVNLSWKIGEKSPADFLTIERSASGLEFETVGVLKLAKDISVINWSDEAPRQGQNYYRLKYDLPGEKSYYSKTITVLFGSETRYKFYPNPVDNVLIIRAENPLEILISDNTGRIRIPKTIVRGLHTINVSNLEKGMYVLRITNLLTNAVIQEKLVKN